MCIHIFLFTIYLSQTLWIYVSIHIDTHLYTLTLTHTRTYIYNLFYIYLYTRVFARIYVWMFDNTELLVLNLRKKSQYTGWQGWKESFKERSTPMLATSGDGLKWLRTKILKRPATNLLITIKDITNFIFNHNTLYKRSFSFMYLLKIYRNNCMALINFSNRSMNRI